MVPCKTLDNGVFEMEYAEIPTVPWVTIRRRVGKYAEFLAGHIINARAYGKAPSTEMDKAVVLSESEAGSLSSPVASSRESSPAPSEENDRRGLDDISDENDDA